MSTAATRPNRQAVVIGGSLAGLLAARVLADFFDQVTVIERDRLPDGPELRSGVPQARHLHILLGRGHQILERFFPGLDADLEAAGAPMVEWAFNTVGVTHGLWAPRFHSGVRTRSVSRALLEWQVRRRLVELHPITFLEEQQVNGLIANADRTRITGVNVQARGGSREQRILEADLVVDASGRTSKTPEWLTELGYETPQETVVNSFLGYSTRWYRKPAQVQGDWKGMVIGSLPPANKRGGAIWEVEDGRWFVTLAGAARDYPPTDEAGFLEFARTLPVTAVYDAIRDAEPISDIYAYQRTDNRLRHYERLARWPERLLVLGDAYCGFNPVYGQGMTVAAMGAETLHDQLQENRGQLDGLEGRFQKRLAAVVQTPWLMATGEDLRYPETEGQRPGGAARLVQKYLDRITVVMADDQDVAATFFHVLNLTTPPTALFRPSILFRVLRGSLRSGGQHRPNVMPRLVEG